MTPGEALLGARESRDWSCKGAATRAGLGGQQLANLESGKTDPATVRAETLVALLELYWPDLTLRDLLPRTLFRMEPASPSAMGLLVASATNKNLHAAMRRLARERA
jgi:transcriptional regulator with XRE-family HTH domain